MRALAGLASFLRRPDTKYDDTQPNDIKVMNKARLSVYLESIGIQTTVYAECHLSIVSFMLIVSDTECQI